MINGTEIIKGILKFKGFKESSFKDKLKWIFIIYPFVLFIVAINWFDYITTKRK